MNKGLFLGLTTLDLLYGVSYHPGPNEKLKAQWQLNFAGGPAANAAVAFSILGNEALLCSGLGTHPLSLLAREDLETHGVHLLDYAAVPAEQPILSSIMVGSSGDRCVVYSNTDTRALKEPVEYRAMANGCSILLVDGYYLPQAIGAAAQAARDGVRVVLDGGSWKHGLENLLPHVDYAICSEQFLPPGCKELGEVLHYLSEWNLKGYAVSRGGNAIVACERNQNFSITVPEVTVCDTLGAGDILHGAFCHYIISHPFAQSLEKSARIASESCRYPGTREWITHLKTERRSTKPIER